MILLRRGALISCASLVAVVSPLPFRSLRADSGPRLSGPQKADTEFGRLAARLAQQRLGSAEDDEKLQDQALSILDSQVLEALNAGPTIDFDALNKRLAAMAVQEPPVGENYHAVGLGGTPPVIALVANFGPAGPSAVRLYSAVAGRYARAARIDKFAQKEFFDENLELVPVPAARGTLFVTVAGRTDELQTGSYVAWVFDSGKLRAVWTSDLLQQSEYSAGADGFRLTYCAETDEDNPRICRRMTRDRYAWEGGTWKRVEQKAAPVPKR